MKARIMSRTGPCPGLNFTLGTSPMTIGRLPGVEIVIPSTEVSRRHARIVFEQGRFYIEDLKSTNGTFLNTMDVEREALNHLDVITFGKETDFIVVIKKDETPVHDAPAMLAASLLPEGGALAIDLMKPITIVGRVAPADIILENPSVSKQHAQIEKLADRLRVIDLGSANGTFVNGSRITSADLTEGDTLAFAGFKKFTIRLLVSGEARDDDAAPPQSGRAGISAETPSGKTVVAWNPAEVKQRMDEMETRDKARRPTGAGDARRGSGKMSAPEFKAPAPPPPPEPQAPAAPEMDLPATRIGPIPQAWVDALKGKPPAPQKEEVSAAPPEPKAPAASEMDLPATRIGPIPQAWADALKGKLPVSPLEAKPPEPAEPGLAATKLGPVPKAWADAIKGQPPPAQSSPGPAPSKAAAPPRPAAPVSPPPAPAPDLEPIPPTMELEALRDSGAGPPAEPIPAPAPRVPVLVAAAGGDQPPLELKPGASTVGRTTDRDIVIDDHRVSRLHATFRVDEYVVLLTDEESANGTWVNDEKIKWRELKEGDTIRFGAVIYKLTFRQG